MIKSFKCRETQSLFEGRFSHRLPQTIQPAAARKLEILAAATMLDELKVPPGNQLERLIANRMGQHSIRINRQWRICFVWRETDAYDVEIVDYH